MKVLFNTVVVEWYAIKSFMLGSFITGFFLVKLSVIRKPKCKYIHEFKAKGEL